MFFFSLWSTWMGIGISCLEWCGWTLRSKGFGTPHYLKHSKCAKYALFSTLLVLCTTIVSSSCYKEAKCAQRPRCSSGTQLPQVEFCSIYLVGTGIINFTYNWVCIHYTAWSYLVQHKHIVKTGTENSWFIDCSLGVIFKHSGYGEQNNPSLFLLKECMTDLVSFNFYEI